MIFCLFVCLFAMLECVLGSERIKVGYLFCLFVCVVFVCLDRDPGAVGKLLGEAGGRFGGGVQCSCSR